MKKIIVNCTTGKVEETEVDKEELASILPILTEQDFTIAIQSYLDTTAQKTKWDSMQSARATAGVSLLGDESESEVAMHADAVKLARWYLKVWAFCYAQLDAIKAGEREVPASTDAFIEELPVMPDYPSGS